MKKTYLRKPAVIEAVQFNGKNFEECRKFLGDENFDNTLKYPNIKTLNGVVAVEVGEFICKGIKGEFYPCKPDIFKEIYEELQ